MSNWKKCLIVLIAIVVIGAQVTIMILAYNEYASKDSISAVSTTETKSLLRTGVGSPAYGIIVWQEQRLVYWRDINQPNSWNVISPQYGSLYVGGDFMNGDFTKLYVISYLLKDLRWIDTRTGAYHIIGRLGELENGGGWTGMTGGSKMYVSSADGYSSYLYTINLSTGGTTLIGKICDDCTVISIAITPNNIMYGLDLHNDVLMSINPVTARGSVIGDVGFNANNAQGMDYDPATHTLYLAAYNNTDRRGELRVVNTNTGMTTFVGVFPDGEEVDVFAFPTLESVIYHIYCPIIMRAK